MTSTLLTASAGRAAACAGATFGEESARLIVAWRQTAVQWGQVLPFASDGGAFTDPRQKARPDPISLRYMLASLLQSRGVTPFSFAYLFADSTIIERIMSLSGAIQPLTTFH